MKILIVDDEPPARARLLQLIADLELGEVVGEAGNGRDALVATDIRQPDVVLLDIRMPGMDGLEVARHLSGFERAPSVIFTTAYDDHALAAFETNAIDYLLKPIRRERLTEALRRAVRPTRAQLSGLQISDESNKARTHFSATLSDRLQVVPGGGGALPESRAQVRDGGTPPTDNCSSRTRSAHSKRSLASGF